MSVTKQLTSWIFQGGVINSGSDVIRSYDGGITGSYDGGIICDECLASPFLKGSDSPFLKGSDSPFLKGSDSPFLKGSDSPFLKGSDSPFLKGGDSCRFESLLLHRLQLSNRLSLLLLLLRLQNNLRIVVG